MLLSVAAIFKGGTMASETKQPDHLHMYNLRGQCWCGAHRDDWLRDEDMLEKIGEAFLNLNKGGGSL